VTISIRKLSYAIFVAFSLCTLIATGASASFWSDSNPNATPAPSSDTEPPPAAACEALPGAILAPIAHRIAGGEFDFTVANGNSFTSIGSRFGESPRILARDNGKQDDGRIFLESERDIYHKGTGRIAAVRAVAQASMIDNQIDWFHAGRVVNDEEGIARDVTLRSERAGGTSADPIAAATGQRTPRNQASRGFIVMALFLTCAEIAP